MAYVDDLLLAYKNANGGVEADAATKLAIGAWAQQANTGGLTQDAALANTLALTNDTTAVAAATYQFFTGSAPSEAGLTYFLNSADNANDLNDANGLYAGFNQESRFINFSINLAMGSSSADAFAASYGGVSYEQTVATAYDNIIGNSVAAAAGVDVSAAVAFLSRTENTTALEQFVKSNNPTFTDDQVKLAVKAALIGEILNIAVSTGLGGYAAAVKAYVADYANDGHITANADGGVDLFAAYPATPATGKTIVLTAGVDTGAGFIGTAADDTFVAADVGANATWTVGDALDGGAGTDTLQITSAGNVAVPVGVTVKNIENVSVLTGGTVALDSTSFSGVSSLKTTSVGGATITAGSVTDVTVVDSGVTTTDGSVTITGGRAISATLAAASNADGSDAAAEIVVSGASGTVDLAYTGKYADGANSLMSNIAVTGGSAVNVTVKSGITTAQKTAALTDANNFTVTESAVAVTGTSATTSVTVTQDATVSKRDDGGAHNGRVGVTAGAVTIVDVNAASATAAGKIATVTLTNYGTSTINSGALSTVNLSGTGGTLGITHGALTTNTVTSLALNLGGGTLGDITVNDGDIKTLNITGSTATTTVSNVTAAGVETLNIAGSSAVVLSDNTFAGLKTVTVTNTAGATLAGTAIGADVTFTGGVGDDSVILSNGFTKAITMGDGDDTVTYGGAAGTGGSVSAGAGTDTIVMTAAEADGVDSSSTFNTTFSGFETLELSDDAGGKTINLAGINGVSTVVIDEGASTGAAVFQGFASGGTLVLTDSIQAGGSYEVEVTNALLNTNDSFNVAIAGTAAITAGSVTVAGVETVNIDVSDASGSGSAAVVHTLTLEATEAKSVTVSGNNGLTLTNNNSDKITSFDASGVVANGTADTADKLAVTYTSANDTASATVTIKGGAGNDVLTGNDAKDTITGGAGGDILSGGLGQDTLNVGVGHDVVKVASNSDQSVGVAFSDSTTAAADIVNGFTLAGAVTAAVDISTAAKFIAATAAGGVNASVLSIDFTQDDAGAGTGANLAVAIHADGTGTGQAAGVTWDVTDGILTLSGTGASTVDTLGEWLTEAAAVAATNGQVVAFQFGADTYVFGQNGASDVLVELVGVSAQHLALTSGTYTGAAGTVLIGDSL